MNHNYTTFRFPHVKPLDWETVFQQVGHNDESMPNEAIDLISKMLIFNPDQRITAFEALAHPFFNELREEGTTCGNGKPLPPLFDFDREEIQAAQKMNIFDKVVPERFRESMLELVKTDKEDGDKDAEDDVKTSE